MHLQRWAKVGGDGWARCPRRCRRLSPAAAKESVTIIVAVDLSSRRIPLTMACKMHGQSAVWSYDRF